MEIDPRRLRVLRAVALRGGVMQAARLLHLTPSAVSQQLMQLEREVGLAVIDHSSRKSQLTAAGRILAACAERLEGELAGARRELALLSGRVSGRVAIAAFPTVIRHLLAPTLEALVRTHPEIEPSVIEVEGEEALRELRTGGLDMVLAEHDSESVPQAPSGLALVALLDDAYRVVVPGSWERKPRTFAELADAPWIASPSENACGRALERLAAANGFAPRKRHTCIEFPAALALVAAGLGAAIVPELALLDAPREGVALAPIPGVGSRRLSAWHRVDAKGPEPVVAALLAPLLEHARALEPARLVPAPSVAVSHAAPRRRRR